MRRRVLPITAAAALAAMAALTGCTAATSDQSSAESCTPAISPGALSDSVRISGDSADTLSVSLLENTPLLNSERTVTVEAEGRERVAVAGSVITANIAYVDGMTGEVLDVSPSFMQGNASEVFLADPGDVFSANLLCAAGGDIVSLALSKQESEALNYLDGELLLLTEVVSVSELRASGNARVLPAGFPAVTVDATGRPGVVLPPQSAPSEAQTAARIEGTGDIVTAEDLVVGQVLTVGWDGQQQSNTWETMLTAIGTEAQTQSSFRAALTGFPLGSQVVVIEPSPDGVAKVHVIDILSVL